MPNHNPNAAVDLTNLALAITLADLSGLGLKTASSPSPSNSRPRPHWLQPQGDDLTHLVASTLLTSASRWWPRPRWPHASTSPTSASRRWPRSRWPRPHPRPRWPHDLDLDIGDLALDLDLDNLDLNLDLDVLGLSLKIATTMTPGRKVASHPWQELTGNLASWLQLWFCSSLHHLACVLHLNRSSSDAYVAYGVCSTIFAMPFLGSNLGNSVPGLYCH
jgi:hypothetical protein